MNSARCYLGFFPNHDWRCSRYKLRAKAKIKLPEEDGLGRGNSITQERRGLCLKSTEEEKRTGNTEEPRQGIQKYKGSKGEGKA